MIPISTPLVLIFLEKYMASNSIAGWYICLTSLISFITIWFFKEKLNIKYFYQNAVEQQIYQLN